MNDTYSVVYSSQAMNDLKKIYLYISNVLLVPKTAERQVNRIRETIRSLDFMPSRYCLVDNEPWKSMKMHKVTAGNFIIFYTVDDSCFTVTVIRIFYGGRDIEKLVSDTEIE